MPFEPKTIPIRVREGSIMRKSVSLLIATLLAVGLACTPASAQNDDDDDDDKGAWIPILVFAGVVGNTKSPHSLKGNFHKPGRGGLHPHNSSVRLNAAPLPGRRAISEQAQMMRTSRPLFHQAGARHVGFPAGARHVGFGRRF